ncbi:hypothetical protein, partial [Ferrovibrio terrae]|uniref:hypothetical protein n=1 Tax=Ferrovibrio terrae TaxID=2594003 RepID=UPI00313788D5
PGPGRACSSPRCGAGTKQAEPASHNAKGGQTGERQRDCSNLAHQPFTSQVTERMVAGNGRVPVKRVLARR